MAYHIVEFEDGLQIVPTEWLNDNNKKCVWPPYTNQIKINQAISKKISPSDDWKLYKVIRIFSSCDTYDKAKDNLKLAEQISDIDGNDENDNLKKSRHERAKKNISSSSENSDDPSNTIHKSKICVGFPKIPNDLKSKMVCEKKKPVKKSIETIEKKNNIKFASLHNKFTHLQGHKRSNEKLITTNLNTISPSTSDSCSKESADTYSVKELDIRSNEAYLDLHNLIIRKLNTILLSLNTIDERLIRLENRIVNKNDQLTADTMENKNYDFDLPADTMEDLKRIDCQLQDKCVAAEMILRELLIIM